MSTFRFKLEDVTIKFSDFDLDAVLKDTVKDRRLVETEADQANDMQSIYRFCEKKLYMVLKKDGKWTLPTVQLENDDCTLRKVPMCRLISSQC